MTWFALLGEGRQRLDDSGIADADTDAWILLSYLTGFTRAQYFLHMQEPAGEQVRAEYEKLLNARCGHIPLQHLTGTQEFYGRAFLVNADVLIPRPETELLVEWALELLPQNARVLDLCTGSGCIAVTLKKERPDLCVCATDISAAALETAQKNAARLNAAVDWFQGDLLEAVRGSFDAIVSNPPYICTGELKELAPEVRGHEPGLALDGGADGLDFYHRIVRKAPACLRPGGWLLMEIGCNQEAEVKSLLSGGLFTEISCRRDYAGYARMIAGRKK